MKDLQNKYNPSKEDKELIGRIYTDFEYMRNLRNQRWKYFNDRTLKELIDDAQLRLNGYVPSRASQGKEPWQSNFFHPVTKNKFKASIAAVALDIPQTKLVAQNEKFGRDATRADIMKHLVKFSYDQDNKEEQIFFEAWEALEKGTVIVYDGYLKSNSKRKIIKSFDPKTGEIETEEKDIETDNQCVNFIVPLMNLYIWDWTIFDIQKQPKIQWVERMDVESFNTEFGKYPNANYVKTSAQLTDKNEADTFFKEFWQERLKGDEPIEVIKSFDKGKDEFVILANGVKLFESPIILGKKKKWYPFAKTVSEPFGTDFFYGNPFPNSLMGEQDIINSLYNMTTDKTYRSMITPMLIGNTNKDDFDLEDHEVTLDTKIYVQDIEQVKPMPIAGVSQSDVKMIEIISRGLDLSSVDSNQQGVAGRGVTAREVVIANENAKKLKGILYMFLTSLWIQKIKLRIMNILTYYPQPKVEMIVGEKGTNRIDKYRSFMVDNAELSDGSKGTLGISMVGSEQELPSQKEVDIQEEKQRMQSGDKYEQVYITSDYLDDWIYDIKVVSDSIYQKESGLTQVKMEEKLRVLGVYFPDIVTANKEKLAKDTLIAYEDEPDEYELAPKAPTQPGMEEPAENPAEALATAAGQGMKPLPPL